MVIQNHVTCLDDYPPGSPDLNAMENVWSWMNRFIQHRFPRSQQYLEKSITAAWDTLPRHVILGYVDNVRRVCERIIANQEWESSRR
jgi:hypothetical protein